MKKSVLVFGLVLGLILCVNMIYMVHLFYTNPDFKGNDFIGYATMVVIFSLIFFGVRNYRNKVLDGQITFGKAFKAGLLMAFIGATMYVATWLVYYYNFVPDFMDKYVDYVLKQCTPTDLPAKAKEMESMKEMYKNPLFVILMTYAEVLPVGIVVALISALVLKRKNKKTPGYDELKNLPG